MSKKKIKASQNKDFKKAENDSVYVYVGLGVIAAAALFFFVFKPSSQASEITGPLELANQDWIKGGSESQNVLIEYSDFQCPACSYYADIVKKASEENPDSFRLVYRHFPLNSIHPYAGLAARAAEAAGLQGKFWEMHDILFLKQSRWSGESNPSKIFALYAKDLGLDDKQFSKDLKSSDVKNKVDNDIASGNDLGINGTPSFYLNGVKIVPPSSMGKFKELLNSQSQGQIKDDLGI